jgi:hypothetical protein
MDLRKARSLPPQNFPSAFASFPQLMRDVKAVKGHYTIYVMAVVQFSRKPNEIPVLNIFCAFLLWRHYRLWSICVENSVNSNDRSRLVTWFLWALGLLLYRCYLSRSECTELMQLAEMEDGDTEVSRSYRQRFFMSDGIKITIKYSSAPLAQNWRKRMHTRVKNRRTFENPLNDNRVAQLIYYDSRHNAICISLNG